MVLQCTYYARSGLVDNVRCHQDHGCGCRCGHFKRVLVFTKWYMSGKIFKRVSVLLNGTCLQNWWVKMTFAIRFMF